MAFEEKNYENYTIEVHSLKSIAKQIGAGALSEFAAQLEKAGHEGNLSFIDTNTEALLADYRELKKKLRPLFADEVAVPVGEKIADKESIVACLEQLIATLEEIDSLAIEEALESFDQYTYGRESEKKYLEQIRKASEEFDIDLCMELAVKWKEEIT